MLKVLLLITLTLALFESTSSQQLFYTRWLRVFEYLHDSVTFDLELKAEIARIKADAAVNDTDLCEKLAQYGSQYLAVNTLFGGLSAEITKTAPVRNAGLLFDSAAIDAIAQLDAAAAEGDEVSFAASREKEVVRVELLAQSVNLSIAEARLQRQTDIYNITSAIALFIISNPLSFPGNVVNCANIRNSGLLDKILNPDLNSTVLSTLFFILHARRQLIDRLEPLVPDLAYNVTADPVLRAKDNLTLRDVIDDLLAKSRQHFLERVARKLHTWEELKEIFGLDDPAIRKVFFKRLRDFFDDFFNNPVLLASFDVKVQVNESPRYIQLDISYDARTFSLSAIARRLAFVTKQFIYAFSHPFDVTFSATSLTVLTVRIHPAPLFDPRQIIPFDYDEAFDNITNGTGVPPTASDGDFTDLLTVTQGPGLNLLKTTFQNTFDEVNQTVEVISSDVQQLIQTAVDTYKQVDISSIATQIRNYATENFDLTLLKQRALAAAAQVRLTIRTIKAKVQEDEAQFNVTLATLFRLEKALSLQLLTLLSSLPPSTTCNVSTDFQTSPTAGQLYTASADATCQLVVPILVKSLPIKRRLLLVLLARKAHNITFTRVQKRISAVLENLNDVVANVSDAITDNFRTPKPREVLHALWDSPNYLQALAKCLYSLNNRTLVTINVSVEVVAEFTRRHKVSAEVNLTISGQPLADARDKLVAQLPLCIAQLSGGDLSYLKAKATVAGSVKRDVEQNTITAQQDTVTSSSSSTTGSGSGSMSTSYGSNLVPAIVSLLIALAVLMF